MSSWVYLVVHLATEAPLKIESAAICVVNPLDDPDDEIFRQAGVFSTLLAKQEGETHEDALRKMHDKIDAECSWVAKYLSPHQLRELEKRREICGR